MQFYRDYFGFSCGFGKQVSRLIASSFGISLTYDRVYIERGFNANGVLGQLDSISRETDSLIRFDKLRKQQNPPLEMPLVPQLPQISDKLLLLG